MRSPSVFAKLLILFAIAFALSSCATSEKRYGKCHAPPESRRKDEPIATLNSFSEMMESKCFAQAIKLGEWIRKNMRDKDYSVSTEVVSVFVPEESVTNYVMESYERAYLSFMMATAYLGLGKKDEAAVELRKSYSEGKAIIYNYGDDPVNTLLLAAMWDNLGEPGTARPFWKKISELSGDNEPLRETALHRITEIDEGTAPLSPWGIYGVGRFPQLDWGMNFIKSSSGFYEVKNLEPLAGKCGSQTGARIDVASWINKINLRYAQDYHPLLHVKSWVRFPIGVAYGISTFTAGLGVAFTGCAMDAKGKGGGALCETSVKAGGYLMAHSTDVAGYALKPDLRHWSDMPAAIVVTQMYKLSEEACYEDMTQSYRDVVYKTEARP